MTAATETSTLPDCIHPMRIGYWRESECDEFGELAPITWVCACGSRLKLENYVVEESSEFGDYIGDNWYPDIIDEGYRPVAPHIKARFLEQHSHCKQLCFMCRKVEVDHFQGWCDACTAKDNERWENPR